MVFLPTLKPACSSAMIFSACGFNLFSMIFKHDFAWVTDEANCSEVPALLQVAFHFIVGQGNPGMFSVV